MYTLFLLILLSCSFSVFCSEVTKPVDSLKFKPASSVAYYPAFFEAKGEPMSPERMQIALDLDALQKQESRRNSYRSKALTVASRTADSVLFCLVSAGLILGVMSFPDDTKSVVKVQ